MASKVGNATNKKIIELLTDYRANLLVLRPRFQRNLVWNDAHKANFLKTIFDQMPFPEIYLADGEIDLVNQKTTILVVDGQQRLSTIFNYIDKKLDLTKYGVPFFDNLDADKKVADEKQREFLSYIVVIRQIGKLSDDEIREIFRRINSVNYALNAVEISNALYEGEFISIAKAIAEEPGFKDLEVITDSEASRMKDIEYVLLIAASVELGYYFTQASELEEIIKRYNDEYPNGKKLLDATKMALANINSLVFDYDSIWYRKSSMFSLLTEVTRHYFKGGSPIIQQRFEQNLKDAELKILTERILPPDINKFSRFYKHMFQQTTSRTGRQARGTIVEEIVQNSI